MALTACGNTIVAERRRPRAGAGWWGAVRKRLFGIPAVEVSLARRGIVPATPQAGQRLELIGRTFVQGYHAALRDADESVLAITLSQIDLEIRGFAFEGAAMALYLLDRLTPWRRNRFERLLAGTGQAHVYMMYVGAGWAMARLRRRPGPLLAKMDPLLGWLAVDGLAFHEAYFHPRKSIEDRAVSERIEGYERRVFDQGLGRGMWFALGADIERITRTIGEFPPPRRSELWSGVGLACAYAGGIDQSAIELLRKLASAYMPEVAQGVAFAAQARQRAGNPAEHTEMACKILCDMSAAAAASVTDHALVNLPPGGEVPAFEVWRQRIQARFKKGGAR